MLTIDRFFLIFIGISIGLIISWPGIILSTNWVCLIKVISNNANPTKISASLKILPKSLIDRKRYRNITGKIRIISDLCFR